LRTEDWAADKAFATRAGADSCALPLFIYSIFKLKLFSEWCIFRCFRSQIGLFMCAVPILYGDGCFSSTKAHILKIKTKGFNHERRGFGQ